MNRTRDVANWTRGVCVAAAVVLLAVACGGSAPSASQAPTNDPLANAARKEGKLTLALHAGSSYQKFGQLVKQQFPYLDVQVTNIKPSDLAPKVIAEQKRGQYLWDLHAGPASNMHDVLAPAGALQSIDPALQSLPTSATDDTKWANGFRVFPEPGSTYTLFTSYTLEGGFYVDKSALGGRSLPSWNDLLGPAYKGRIVIYDPSKDDGSSQGLAGVLAAKGPDFVRHLLVDQKPVFVSTSRQAAQWVVQGKYPVGIGINSDDMASFQSQGLGDSVTLTYDGVPATLLAGGVSMFKNAPHPNAVKLFLRWYLSQAGQDAWAKTIEGGNSRRLDVPVYHKSLTPDYRNLSQYKVVVGTNAGGDLVKNVTEIARSRS